ncbi:hypothetical protein [Bacteroides neonati]|uniref:hypothetical protein n=1 Tax=Bacteroides neonati TaxID=1347393 RepID=UPI0004B18784|nr:hypothetical protein [Bacteroides neonati]
MKKEKQKNALIEKESYIFNGCIITDVKFIGLLIYRKMATHDCVAKIGLKPL